MAEDSSLQAGRRRKREADSSSREAPPGIICITRKASVPLKADPTRGFSLNLAALVCVVASVDAAVDVRPIAICPMRNGRRDDEHGKDGGVFF